jgi:hypothetical protein
MFHLIELLEKLKSYYQEVSLNPNGLTFIAHYVPVVHHNPPVMMRSVVSHHSPLRQSSLKRSVVQEVHVDERPPMMHQSNHRFVSKVNDEFDDNYYNTNEGNKHHHVKIITPEE